MVRPGRVGTVAKSWCLGGLLYLTWRLYLWFFIGFLLQMLWCYVEFSFSVFLHYHFYYLSSVWHCLLFFTGFHIAQYDVFELNLLLLVSDIGHSLWCLCLFFCAMRGLFLFSRWGSPCFHVWLFLLGQEPPMVGLDCLFFPWVACLLNVVVCLDATF